MDNLLAGFFWMILFGGFSALVARSKGRSETGWFFIGTFTGFIGFALILLASKNEAALEQRALRSGALKKCPSCAELIKAEAAKCRHCGVDQRTKGSPPVQEYDPYRARQERLKKAL